MWGLRYREKAVTYSVLTVKRDLADLHSFGSRPALDESYGLKEYEATLDLDGSVCVLNERLKALRCCAVRDVVVSRAIGTWA